MTRPHKRLLGVFAARLLRRNTHSSSLDPSFVDCCSLGRILRLLFTRAASKLGFCKFTTELAPVRVHSGEDRQ